MKTEKQKMLEGLVYDANNDAELIRERTECADALHTYNSLLPSDTPGRAEILRKLFASTGRNFMIVSPFYCDYGYNISVGENFFMNTGCVILDGAEVSFGDDVFVAPMCGFYTAGHLLDREARAAGLEYAYPIKIGNGVWIGAQCSILPGVSIGDGSVIGAGSVVTRSIPAGVLAFGNPCRVVRTLGPGDRERTCGVEGLLRDSI